MMGSHLIGGTSAGKVSMARELLKTLVQVEVDTVTVTYALGKEVPGAVEWASYGVKLFGPGGVGGKEFGVRFGPDKVSAYIFDFPSATQSNYDATCVDASESSIVVRFRDASLGIPSVGSSSGWSAVNGKDSATDVPVVVLD
jgi:hypothetical protein